MEKFQRRPSLQFVSAYLSDSCKDLLCACKYTNLLCILSVDPPKVTHHPKSRLVPTGTETTFEVKATGDDLTFQWLKNGSDVHNDSNYSGTDTNTLSIRHVKKNDGGHYRCLVRNEVKRDGEVSEEAQLTVCEFCFAMLILHVCTAVCHKMFS